MTQYFIHFTHFPKLTLTPLVETFYGTFVDHADILLDFQKLRIILFNK